MIWARILGHDLGLISDLVNINSGNLHRTNSNNTKMYHKLFSNKVCPYEIEGLEVLNIVYREEVAHACIRGIDVLVINCLAGVVGGEGLMVVLEKEAVLWSKHAAQTQHSGTMDIPVKCKGSIRNKPSSTVPMRDNDWSSIQWLTKNLLIRYKLTSLLTPVFSPKHAVYTSTLLQ